MAAAVAAAPAAAQDAEEVEERLAGEFRWGPLFLRPHLRIDRAGFDTNVFNSPEDPESDFVLQGGPGLDLRLPVAHGAEAQLGGSASYLYYHEHPELRRWSALGFGGASWQGQRTGLAAVATYRSVFDRPEFEIDDRIQQASWRFRGTLEQSVFSRILVSVAHVRERLFFEEGFTSEGANPAANRNQDRYATTLELHYRATEKTSLFAGGDYQEDRFDIATDRDADSNRVYLGLSVVSRTRLRGYLKGGVRLYRFKAVGEAPTLPYADARLAYAFGPRTHLTLSYSNDREYTFFSVVEGPPTALRESLGSQLDKALWGDLELRLGGRLSRLKSDGTIVLSSDGKAPIVAEREDETGIGTINLGFRLRSAFRIGAEARYYDRRSNLEGFDVRYWVYGATVEYIP